MARTIHLLRFRNNQPVWFRFEDERLIPSEPPDPKSRGFVAALLPDELFFYYQPVGVQTASPRKAQAAARLQMNHLFPAFGVDRQIGVFRPMNGQVLSFFSRPGLSELLEQNRELLARANLITTELALCWFDAVERNVPTFIWRGEDHLKALYTKDNLEFFSASESELESRLAREDSPAPEHMELEPVLARHLARRKNWSLMRAPIRQPKADKQEMRPYKRAILVALCLGLVFIAGQTLRWKQQAQVTDTWREQLNQLYSTVLGPEPGPDPYGKLLYTLDQLQQGRAQGVQVLKILSILSQDPPENLSIEDLNLSVDSGVIRGRTSTYDSLEAYLDGLSSSQGYSFSLEQATNTDNGIQFTLQVTMPQ